MDKIINLGIPHIGEQVFASLEASDLIRCLEVSQTWRVLAEKVFPLLPPCQLKGKLYEACKTGKAFIVELLVKNYNSEEIGLNLVDKGTYRGSLGKRGKNTLVLTSNTFRRRGYQYEVGQSDRI